MAPMALIMGIVNVTPDSFSDGGRFLRAEAAIEHGVRMVEEGAAILDIGGESTRPGADAVDASEEIDRVIPVIEGLVNAEVAASISIDTSKAQVAERALAAGATTVNDVTALGDPEMAGVCARAEAQVILMHMKGTPRTMQADPTYDDVVAEVSEFLAERVAVALEAGIAKERILVDPGIGFGKTVDHNLELIERLGELKALDRPIVFGASRKSFIGKIGGGEAADRLGGTVAANVIALERGADVLRVHDVAPAREAMLVAEAIIGGWQWAGYGPRT